MNISLDYQFGISGDKAAFVKDFEKIEEIGNDLWTREMLHFVSIFREACNLCRNFEKFSFS